MKWMTIKEERHIPKLDPSDLYKNLVESFADPKNSFKIHKNIVSFK